MEGVALAVTLAVGAPAIAQEPTQAATPRAGLETHGSVDVGVRSTTISGSEAMYRRVFDLSDGLRLMKFELHGAAPRTADLFADAFALSVSGVGDPLPSMQFTMRKKQRYDLRVNWRRNRFVDTYPLTPASIDGLDTRVVTDFHAWTTSRQLGNAALTVDATSRLHLLFNYSRASRSGDLLSTRSLDFVGAPAAWAAFARANPYQVTTPVDDVANRFTGGLSYGATRWSVNYHAGYQRYEERQELSPLAVPERSINIADPTTAAELLESLAVSQNRRLTSPVSELSAVVRPSARTEWRGEYFFYRYGGPFDSTGAYRGVARTNNAGTAVSPYDLAVAASGHVTSPNHVVTQTFAYRPADRWSVEGEYRYSRFATDVQGTLASALKTYPTAAPVTSQDNHQSWQQIVHTAGVLATFNPTPTLTIRPGLRFSHRDIERRADEVLDPATSNRMKTVWPEITVGYHPSPLFSARGSYRVANSDVSYTRLSPVQRAIGHVVARLEPLEGLAIEVNANQTDAEQPEASFVSHSRLGSVHASYSLSDRLTAVGGIDYQSFLALGSVSFLRGVAPITDDEMRDEERTRTWLAGAVIQITSRIGVTATANFQRTTGTDAIAGEPPLYGPMTFPYGTGSVYYDLPRAGRLSLDLQRSHLYQDILPLNDFQATLVTVRFSRDF